MTKKPTIASLQRALAKVTKERDNLARVLPPARAYLASTARDYATKERKGLEEAVRSLEVGT